VRIALKLTLVLLAGICLVLAAVMQMQVERETALFESDMQHDNALMGRYLSAGANAYRRSEGQAAADRFIQDQDGDQRGGAVRIRRISRDQVPPAQLKAFDDALATGVGHSIDRDERGEGSVLTYVPLWNADPPIALEVSESLAAERKYVRATVLRHLATAGAIAGICGVMALGLGYWMVGGPIRRMVAQTRRVGAGDLTGRLGAHSRDELGELAGEIDGMTEALAEAGRRLAAETAARIQTIEQLRRADRLATVGTLASGVAHELGTPLSVVTARAKMIATGEVAGDPARESASIVMEQAGRMGRIIRQLLDFARPRRPVREPLDLRQLVRQVGALLGPMGAQRSVRLEVGDGHAPVTASADSAQIQQVLSNLVMNGIQACHRGGRVLVRAATQRAKPPADLGGEEGPYALLSVEDDGQGIPEDHLVHLFEPFFTTKDVGEGTGLGLSVSAGIVREHGGWIAVASRPGQTRFDVFLPLGSP
jgi:signal transduction histidine kinase